MKLNLSEYRNHKIFLLDASGALLTTILLSMVYSFQEYFGMPKNIISVFIGIALALFLYSSVIYLIKPKNWKIYLKLIALLNLSYCVFTTYHIFQSLENLSTLGKFYFIGEVLIIILISFFEFKLANSSIEIN